MRRIIIFLICLVFVVSAGCPGESVEHALVTITKQFYSAQHGSRFGQSYTFLDSHYKSYVSKDEWVENQKQVFMIFLPKPEDIKFKKFSIVNTSANVEIEFEGIDPELARHKLTELALKHADQGQAQMMHYSEKYILDNRAEYSNLRQLTLNFTHEDSGWKLIHPVPEELIEKAKNAKTSGQE